MSWIDVEPSPDKAIAAVKISISAAGGRYAQRMTVLLRPGFIEGASWLRRDAPVRVQLGRDGDAGQLRISPGGGWKVMSATGKHATSLVRLNLPTPHDTTLAPLKMRPVEFDYGDDWLQITLPAMMSGGIKALLSSSPIATTPSQAAAKLVKSAPYVGVSATVPDQATVLSRQLGRKVR